jgi:hypothetical protein
MCAKQKQEAQNPLILRSHRLMEAFAKADDERDFYIDRLEGFLIYVDLNKSDAELDVLEEELKENSDRYCPIPKFSFYEIKKIMESFVNEKVYDIDTKEKLLDIIQSKEAKENFLEFIYDHHGEQEKWQQFYQERSRIRIIEWLRQNHFHFVFEEDLDLSRQMTEKLKQALFQPKAGKDIQTARKALSIKAKTYYSNEALNPRPKRGRPPKQAIKLDIGPQVSLDIYTTVPPAVRPFLFTPDPASSSVFSIFSSKFEGEEGGLLASRLQQLSGPKASLSQKFASLRSLSSRWLEEGTKPPEETTKGNIEEKENKPDKELDQPSSPSSKEPKSTQNKKSKPSIRMEEKKSKPHAAKVSDKQNKPEKFKAKRIMPRPQDVINKKPRALKKIIP